MERNNGGSVIQFLLMLEGFRNLIFGKHPESEEALRQHASDIYERYLSPASSQQIAVSVELSFPFFFF